MRNEFYFRIEKRTINVGIPSFNANSESHSEGQFGNNLCIKFLCLCGTSRKLRLQNTAKRALGTQACKGKERNFI